MGELNENYISIKLLNKLILRFKKGKEKISHDHKLETGVVREVLLCKSFCLKHLQLMCT